MNRPLLMIGLDGVGAAVLRSLIAEGLTPNLASHIEKGCCGPLRATVPPITGPSWLGIATGLDVDQTGVADFLVRRPPLFDLRAIGSREFRGRSIWDHAAAAGLRTCVFNFPILFPPYDANGLMVSGFGTDESTQWTSPQTLKAELIEAAGRDYNLSVNYHSEQYDDVSLFLGDLEASIDRRVRAASWLLSREDWDLAVCVFSETDWLMHRCWHILDANESAAPSPEDARLRDRARAIFTRIDRAVPLLMDAIGDGASLLVCSDHGFGSNTGTFKVNAALERAGLLKRRAPSRRGASAIHRASVRLAQRAGVAAARAPGSIGRTLSSVRRRARRFLPRDDSAYLSTVIDTGSSEAFDPGHTIPFGGLYVGPAVERGSGVYAMTLDRVGTLLTESAFESGVSLEIRRPWLEAQSHPDSLPDLLVSGDDWGTTFSKTEFDGPLFVPGPYSARHTGSHRIDGVYVASGPCFEPSTDLAPASVLDIAPTVLACLGLAAPQECRGRILPSFAGERTGLPAAAATFAGSPESEAADDEDVRERLRGLGYIE